MEKDSPPTEEGTHSVSTAQLRLRLAEILEEAKGGRITNITSYGKNVAAVVSHEDAALLRGIKAGRQSAAIAADAELLRQLRNAAGDLSQIATLLQGLAASHTTDKSGWAARVDEKAAVGRNIAPDRK